MMGLLFYALNEVFLILEITMNTNSSITFEEGDNLYTRKIGCAEIFE